MNYPSTEPFIRDFVFDDEQLEHLHEMWEEGIASDQFHHASTYDPNEKTQSTNYTRFCYHYQFNFRHVPDIALTLRDMLVEWYPEQEQDVWFAQMEFIHYSGVGQTFMPHTDDLPNGETHGRLYTTVTMLEKSDDLIGGTLKVWVPREGTVMGWDGQYWIDLEVGETIMFPAYFMHEVTPLVQGDRRVLISWGQIGTQQHFTEVVS